MGTIRGRYRYTSGYCRTRREFVADDFGAYDVECPVCGGRDNHCANRRGLCCSCYCALANKVGADAVARMTEVELVREGTRAALAALEKGTYTIEPKNAKAVAAFRAAHAPKPPEPPPLEEPKPRKKTAAEASRERLAKYGKGFTYADKLKANRKWRKEHREQMNAASRRWYEENREAVLAKKKAYRDANRERYKAYAAAYRARKKNTQQSKGDSK